MFLLANTMSLCLLPPYQLQPADMAQDEERTWLDCIRRNSFRFRNNVEKLRDALAISALKQSLKRNGFLSLFPRSIVGVFLSFPLKEKCKSKINWDSAESQ